MTVRCVLVLAMILVLSGAALAEDVGLDLLARSRDLSLRLIDKDPDPANPSAFLSHLASCRNEAEKLAAQAERNGQQNRAPSGVPPARHGPSVVSQVFANQVAMIAALDEAFQFQFTNGTEDKVLWAKVDHAKQKYFDSFSQARALYTSR